LSHQVTCSKFVFALGSRSDRKGSGIGVLAPGVIFSRYDSVVSDVVWITHHPLRLMANANGHLRGALELVVEVLSPGFAFAVEKLWPPPLEPVER
jgi:Uma2 family endonuclease